jgi:hypothetical protein
MEFRQNELNGGAALAGTSVLTISTSSPESVDCLSSSVAKSLSETCAGGWPCLHILTAVSTAKAAAASGSITKR